MKNFLLTLFALAATTAPAFAITVKTPSNGAAVTSPFNLVASTESCDGKEASSMGYSIDHGPTTIVKDKLSFSAMVTAPTGQHILHVKCWGKKVHGDVLLNITVNSSTTPPSQTAATPSFLPAGGTFTTAQTVTLSVATPGAAIYYTLDGSAPTINSPLYSEPLQVTTTTVIEAIAVAAGYQNSGLGRGDFIISQSGTTGPTIPADAIAVTQIQTMPNWKFNHDPGTSGNSQGVMSLVGDPSMSGQAAKFATSFEDWGGEIYSKSYAKDANAMNFVYDNYIWIEAGSVVGNLELDNNQVIPNGDTVIYAFQCAGDHNTWDYSSNAGTAAHPNVKWIRSTQPCNPAKWTPNTWHHVQISYSRDNVGNITYHSVWLDGVEQPINETVFGAFAIGWSAGDLMTNFQVDGVGSSGSSVLYADNLTFYRW